MLSISRMHSVDCSPFFYGIGKAMQHVDCGVPSDTCICDALAIFETGAASAVNGLLMMLAAFAVGSWLGRHMDGTVFPLALGVWFWSVLIALLAWTAVQKYGEPVES